MKLNSPFELLWREETAAAASEYAVVVAFIVAAAAAAISQFSLTDVYASLVDSIANAMR